MGDQVFLHGRDLLEIDLHLPRWADKWEVEGHLWGGDLWEVPVWDLNRSWDQVMEVVWAQEGDLAAGRHLWVVLYPDQMAP